MTGLTGRVTIRLGDGARLPYPAASFDGGYAQHVTVNVADREGFRVLKTGAFLALTEHGLGATGELGHLLPWSEDGSGAYLLPPGETVGLGRAGFDRIKVTDTGEAYLAA